MGRYGCVGYGGVMWVWWGHMGSCGVRWGVVGCVMARGEMCYRRCLKYYLIRPVRASRKAPNTISLPGPRGDPKTAKNVEITGFC